SEKIAKLLKLLEGVPFEKRTARFVCSIAVVFRDGSSFTVRETCEGYIGFEPKGSNGFGYDPIFYMPEFGMRTAEREPMQKHNISHRGKALRQMLNKLERKLGKC